MVVLQVETLESRRSGSPHMTSPRMLLARPARFDVYYATRAAWGPSRGALLRFWSPRSHTMFAKRTASAALVLAGLLVGCQPSQPAGSGAAAAPATSSDAAQEMRIRFTEVDPNAVTGVVRTVLADK